MHLRELYNENDENSQAKALLDDKQEKKELRTKCNLKSKNKSNPLSLILP